MGRKPCCEKMGLKKGPWSPQEDHILVNYIRLHGHGNWRALPKQAGLLRCGKSCRLRWANYLRPDIKRGNFSHEEEQAIIQLHQQLGNRWSAIAAKLPGRTDNEIKNVWHTHLKKRLKQHSVITDQISIVEQKEAKNEIASDSSFDVSSNTNNSSEGFNVDNFPEMDEDFWSEVLSAENLVEPENEFQYLGESTFESEEVSMCDGMEFWYNLLNRAGDLPELIGF